MATKILTMLLGLTLILAVACGSAAEPTAAPAAEPTAAPVESATSQPTPVPQVAAPPTEVEVNPGKLTIMVGDLAAERFDNIFSVGAPGGANYVRIMGGYLVSTNEKRQMTPGIASKWDLSPDGLTWTFTIREGVKFHHGSELAPEDALWTLQHYWGPQAFEYHPSSGALISRAMDRIELSGPDEVSMITKRPIVELAYLLSEAGNQWLHVMPKRAQLKDSNQEVAYDNNPIGAGFMRLEKHVPASVMEFERFDDFYYQPDNGLPEDRRVNFQSLDLFLVPEEATRVAALRAGQADIVPISLATKNQVESGGGRVVFGQEGVVWEVQTVGCYDPKYPCHDKRVRQALDYAIDKELIRDTLYGGPEVMEVKGYFFVTPSTIGYTPGLDPFPYDPAKARQLLADAGYPGGQGFGKVIVNTSPASAMPFLVESAQLAADFWRRELGLDVEVRVGDRTAIKEGHRAGELNGQIMWQDQETRTDAIQGGPTRWADPENPTRVHDDPELFSLAQETWRTVDPEQRAEASVNLYLRLRDESHFIGIGYLNIPWGVGPRVVTWEPYPMALFPSALHTITLK
jgi:peptide/nickel transport system substrate-binding protein